MREDIIEVAVELGLNSGDPQAIAVARELAEAGADADSPPITTSVKVRYRTTTSKRNEQWNQMKSKLLLTVPPASRVSVGRVINWVK